MNIKRTRSGYSVSNPPFGSDFIVESLSIREAGRYRACFREILFKNNKRNLEHWLLQINEECRPNSTADNLNLISEQLDGLKISLSQTTKPSFWQKNLATCEYVQKIAAADIIESYFKKLGQDLEGKNETDSLFYIGKWHRKMINELSRSPYAKLKGAFTYNLLAKIKDFFKESLPKALEQDITKSEDIKSHRM